MLLPKEIKIRGTSTNNKKISLTEEELRVYIFDESDRIYLGSPYSRWFSYKDTEFQNILSAPQEVAQNAVDNSNSAICQDESFGRKDGLAGEDGTTIEKFGTVAELSQGLDTEEKPGSDGADVSGDKNTRGVSGSQEKGNTGRLDTKSIILLLTGCIVVFIGVYYKTSFFSSKQQNHETFLEEERDIDDNVIRIMQADMLKCLYTGDTLAMNGMEHQAKIEFKKVADYIKSAPLLDITQVLELSNRYRILADDLCSKRVSIDDLAKQYYEYSAILLRESPQICKP